MAFPLGILIKERYIKPLITMKRSLGFQELQPQLGTDRGLNINPGIQVSVDNAGTLNTNPSDRLRLGSRSSLTSRDAAIPDYAGNTLSLIHI